jgi:hypothetical protein
MSPKPASFAGQPLTPPRVTDVLAREAADNDIDGNSIGSKSLARETGNVIVDGHLWPVFAENLLSLLVDLAERHRAETARALQTKIKAPDPSE